MPSPAPPPNPCLVAILLIIQSRSGPRLVFHYPPQPPSPKEGRDSYDNDDDDGDGDDTFDASTSSDSDIETASTDGEVTLTRQARKGLGGNAKLRRQNGVLRGRLTDEDDDDDDEISGTASAYRQGKEWQPPWETLFGLDGLVTLLTPSTRIWHKRKFEIGINDLCFLGWPVFIREDGTWQKHRAKSKKRRDRKGMSPDGAEQDTADEGTNAEVENGTTKAERTTSTSNELLMFNVVFVMNPPILEYTLRTKEMYDHVVKKFGKFLKWEQARQNYVWTESDLMLSIKSKHTQKRSPTSALYTELLARSTLAQAISAVYTSISTSRIAQVTLSPEISTSLQIPPITSTSCLPSLTDPPNQPGIWLTTANEQTSTSASDLDTSASVNSSHLARHFTLLLTSPPTQILKDISSSSPLSGPLTTLIAHLTPTKSFHKISNTSSISLADMQLLSRHLIYWRRAIAIPPLHQRDTYIVSPNADLRKLRTACKAYEAQFPTLPGLAKMLSGLSGTPRPWGSLFPSPDHKEAYMAILAWLMRGGWVTQLRSFAFVRVDPIVKRAIKDQEKAEKEAKRREDSKNHDEQTRQSQHHHRPSLASRPSSSSDARKRSGKQSSEADQNMASLILNPHRASPLESKYLQHIAESLLTTNSNASSFGLSDEEQTELKRYWLMFVKYFNGAEPLEKIPVREGLKRKVVWDVLGKMGLFRAATEGEEEGKGEGDGQGQGQILLGFRHW